MKKIWKTIMVSFVTMMLFLTSACSSGGGNNGGDAPVSGGDDVMKIEVITAPVGMHPLKTNDAPSTAVSGQIFETLYLRSVDGTSYEPLLASELPIYSEDGKTATIKLREGVKFQDGSDFNAEDVAYMIDSIKDPDYGCLRPSVVESIESYEIIDDYTIQFNLSYEDGVLVAKLAHSNAAIVNPELDQSKDIMIDPTGAGTGAYEFVSSIPGSNYVLKANENYWGGAPEVKNVRFDVVADESTAIARLQTGEADFYASVLADSYSAVSNIPGYTVVNDTSSSIYYLALRSTEESAINPLMADIEFRKALIQAIDFDTYVDTMLGGLASRSQSLVGPTLAGYVKEMEEAGYGFDIEASKATIEANGWAGQSVTLFVSTRKWQQDLAVYIQAELAEVGITVNIISEEWASFLTSAKEDKKYDMVILTWSNVTGDGQQMLEPNFSTKNGVRVKYNNAEFDQMVMDSVMTTVMEERQQAMLNAVNKLQNDAIATPVYSQNQVYVYNAKKYGNIQIDKGGQYDLKNVTIVK